MRAHVQCGADNLRLVWDKLAGKRLKKKTPRCFGFRAKSSCVTKPLLPQMLGSPKPWKWQGSI